MKLHFEHEASADLADWADYDLVIAADGANSRIRDRYRGAFRRRHRGPPQQVLLVRHAARSSTPSPSRSSRPRRGWIWAHAYRFDDDLSTFIVECDPETWAGLGFDRDGPGGSDRALRGDLRQISGRPRLMSNAAHLPRPAGVAQLPPHHLRQLGAREPDPARRRRAYRAFLDRLGHQARARGCDQARRGAEPAGPRPRRRRSPNIRPSATSRCSSCRTARATRPNGSRRSTAISISSRCSSLIRCSPAASASATKICACATGDWLEGVERWFQSKARGQPVNEPAPPMFAPFKLRE